MGTLIRGGVPHARGRVSAIESYRTAPRSRISIRDDESGSGDGPPFPVSGYHAEEWMSSIEYLPSLSEALSIKMIEDDLRKVKKAKKKQHKKQRKIAVSLVRGIFSKKGKSR
jgi:hypothetical protein